MRTLCLQLRGSNPPIAGTEIRDFLSKVSHQLALPVALPPVPRALVEQKVWMMPVEEREIEWAWEATKLTVQAYCSQG